MKRALTLALLLVLTLGSVSCASLGGADPVVVRAEDTLNNSLLVYKAAMTFHYAASTQVKPSTYEALEVFRKKFPPAWRALWHATNAYKASKNKDPQTLVRMMEEVKAMISEITDIMEG